jgi:hypothetical protein
VITNSFPLARVDEAIQLGLRGEAGKILLEP